MRGIDATGISFCLKNKINIIKKAAPASKFNFQIPKDTKIITGHTRMTTQGNEKFNYNNHPFLGMCKNKSFALSHNGVIHNDKELKKNFNIKNSKIETDTYIVIQLLEKEKLFNEANLVKVIENLEGSYSFSILDNKNTLFLVKGSSPLSIYHFENLGLYVYSSTEQILRNSIKRSSLKYVNYESIEIKNGEIFKINSLGILEKFNFNYKENFEAYNFYNDYIFSKRNSYFETLIKYGKQLGYLEEEIIDRYDNGYSFWEIEEYLYSNY